MLNQKNNLVAGTNVSFQENPGCEIFHFSKYDAVNS